MSRWLYSLYVKTGVNILQIAGTSLLEEFLRNGCAFPGNIFLRRHHFFRIVFVEFLVYEYLVPEELTFFSKIFTPVSKCSYKWGR